MKSCIAMPLALFCLLLTPAGAVADQQDDQSACMMDAQTFCVQFIPNRVRVAHCLIVNRKKITPACREAIKHFR